MVGNRLFSITLYSVKRRFNLSHTYHWFEEGYHLKILVHFISLGQGSAVKALKLRFRCPDIELLLDSMVDLAFNSGKVYIEKYLLLEVFLMARG